MAEKLKSKDENQPSEMQKIASSYRSGWAFAEYAFQYAMAIVVCSLLGYWLDNVLHTGQVLLIVGVFSGAVVGFIGLLRSLHVLSFKHKEPLMEKDAKNNRRDENNKNESK